MKTAVFLLSFLWSNLVQTVAREHDSGKLLIILLDGFRWDYLKYTAFGEDGLRRFAREGTTAEYLKPVYPTLSYPNYYSLMTGLYTESHGMIGNYMYDVIRNETFLIGSNPEQYHSHWWNDGDPIWVTAARQKRNSYMFYWPGCDVEIRGLRPRFCEKYTASPTLLQFRSAVNQSVQLFQNGSADLVAIYYEDTDKKAHQYGPFGEAFKNVLKKIDDEIAFLLSEMDRRHIRESVDVMIVSDHGMADMTNVSHTGIIDIRSALSSDEYDVIMDIGGHVIIFASDTMVPRIHHKLNSFHPHMKAYLRHEIPDRWHYKHGRLVAPITLFADLGWFIITPYYPHFPSSPNGEPWLGWHGYDNILSEMDGIFLASGPSFKTNHETGSLDIVDLYQVMCTILNVEPSPHNGSRSHVIDLFVTSSSSVRLESACAVIVSVLLVLR